HQHIQHMLFHRVTTDDVNNSHLTFLAEPMDSVLRLHVFGWSPLRVDAYHVPGSREGDGNASRLDSQRDTTQTPVLEIFYYGFTSLWRNPAHNGSPPFPLRKVQRGLTVGGDDHQWNVRLFVLFDQLQRSLHLGTRKKPAGTRQLLNRAGV